jgi:mono/diheme cytochrome c family protein
MGERPAFIVAAAMLAALLGAGCAKGPVAAAAGERQGDLSIGDRDRGGEIFAANCAVCHGAAGGGGIGPSLKAEKQRKNYPATMAWIQKPDPPMPQLYPHPLSQSDVNDVAAYVQTL